MGGDGFAHIALARSTPTLLGNIHASPTIFRPGNIHAIREPCGKMCRCAWAPTLHPDGVRVSDKSAQPIALQDPHQINQERVCDSVAQPIALQDPDRK